MFSVGVNKLIHNLNLFFTILLSCTNVSEKTIINARKISTIPANFKLVSMMSLHININNVIQSKSMLLSIVLSNAWFSDNFQFIHSVNVTFVFENNLCCCLCTMKELQMQVLLIGTYLYETDISSNLAKCGVRIHYAESNFNLFTSVVVP